MAMTLEQITAVLGPVGKDVAAAIVATDASLAELEEAWAWLQDDESFIDEGRPLPSGRIARLIEILSPPSDEEVAS